MLMGPDHLCALAVVAVPGATDVSSSDGDDEDLSDAEENNDDTAAPQQRRRRNVWKDNAATGSLRRAARSFALGIQWGGGHSIGLGIICAVFFATRKRLDLDGLSEVRGLPSGYHHVVIWSPHLSSLIIIATTGGGGVPLSTVRVSSVCVCLPVCRCCRPAPCASC